MLKLDVCGIINLNGEWYLIFIFFCLFKRFDNNFFFKNRLYNVIVF